MESLSEETWDLVIVGTSLPQALLALALSRSDLKILHVDQNAYYGGIDAGLSLDEARRWVQIHAGGSGIFSHATLTPPSESSSQLASSRAYTLSLNPQIIYAQTSFLPSLVSSRTNEQLEFLAVGSWWICQGGTVQKVPSSREDVFADDTLSRRDKIGLMKFLRSLLQDGAGDAHVQEPTTEGSFHEVLTSKFKISPTLQIPVLSLALEQRLAQDTDFEGAVSRIQRHLRSIGYFGPGFGAVVSKYAGNAEIAQVACRACAVGGGTYLLGQGLVEASADAGTGATTTQVKLTDGVTVRAKRVVGGYHDLPADLVENLQPKIPSLVQSCRSISIVSSPLRHLFPQTSENGPVPAVIIILVADDDGSLSAPGKLPVYIQVHSEDTGECPQGQCLLYASTLYPDGAEPSTTSHRLESAVQSFLNTQSNPSPDSETPTSPPQILWSMSYFSAGTLASTSHSEPFLKDASGQILAFPPPLQDLAFNDGLLDSVKAVWREVVGSTADGDTFMRFEEKAQGHAASDES